MVVILRSTGVCVGVMILMFLSYPAPSFGQLSPGPLHSSHEFIEGVSNCGKCHSERGQVAGDCIKCHDMIKQQLEENKGLHGLQHYSECQLCHIEHQGQKSELIWWKTGMKNFNHILTGYPLQGGHTRVRCRSCHQKENITVKEQLLALDKPLDRTFLGLNAKCATCHFDEHRGQFSGDCTSCHVVAAWRPAPGFDHGKSKFALLGRHRETACEKCHTKIADSRSVTDSSYVRFSGLPRKTCLDCHKDVHDGRLGVKCSECHSVDSWRLKNATAFDHGNTRYPLAGKHSTVKCEKCHPPGRAHRGMKFQHCRDCHADHHGGDFADRQSGDGCKECHTVSGFAPSLFSISLHEDTDYPLTGAHRAVACAGCHPKPESGNPISPARFALSRPQCITCHPDPHKPALEKQVNATGCKLCHITDTWRQVTYEHDKKEYVLEGRHSQIRCRRCHFVEDGLSAEAPSPLSRGAEDSSAVSLKFTSMAKLCSDCHEDTHRGQFQTTTTESSSSLTVTQCDSCHTQTNWQASNFDHDADSIYPLRGAHRKVDCGGCHKSTTSAIGNYVVYKPLKQTCESCHGNQYAREGLGEL